MAEKELNLKLIVEGCRRGNRSSQRRLFEHFFGYGMNVCLRYAKNREEAEEILSTGFLKAFQHIDRYEASHPFRAWLRRILINTAIDHYRANQKYPALLELHTAADVESEEAMLPFLSPNEDVLPILQQLTTAYRLVFNLSVMEGYRHDEIAEMLGISASASRSNLVRAKEKLRTMLLEKSGQAAKTN